jgi:hypothetical protein
MPGGDHGHGDSGGWDSDGGFGGPAPAAEGPATQWKTLGSPLSALEVRERIRRALKAKPPFTTGAVFSGTEGRQGFVVRGKVGKRVVIGEVSLAGHRSMRRCPRKQSGRTPRQCSNGFGESYARQEQARAARMAVWIRVEVDDADEYSE